ncbi:HEAT repeat domain-containing protein [Actinokineospora globicatena]|uniref:HEAT repeat domain-containing protein n=1 Tax=Actinokineospora globicatena TaxID=103729 RepID=UPI002555BA09|nr:HEAT repeat domain-containing protein [Actinokineospora globicatena]GLW79843.1 hypothetical protein Aglo01_43240 [Actinokineospora globicatena]GLW85747.1 hypothetical protein Aglo02_33870 [Actinokineospora globicatena]
MSAAQAIAVVRAREDARGYQVVVPRAIGRAEIHRVRHVRQVTGWRYEPDAHGKVPCSCMACLPVGAYGAVGIRARFGDDWVMPSKPELMDRLAAAVAVDEIVDVLWYLGFRSRGAPEDVAYLADHPSPKVRTALAGVLARYRGRAAVTLLRRLADDPDDEVREAAVESLTGEG